MCMCGQVIELQGGDGTEDGGSARHSTFSRAHDHLGETQANEAFGDALDLDAPNQEQV